MGAILLIGCNSTSTAKERCKDKERSKEGEKERVEWVDLLWKW